MHVDQQIRFFNYYSCPKYFIINFILQSETTHTVQLPVQLFRSVKASPFLMSSNKTAFFNSLVDMSYILSQYENSAPVEKNTLHLACIGGNVMQVIYCIEVLKNDPYDRDKQGKNAFHLAAQVGHASVLKYLVQSTDQGPSFVSDIENGVICSSLHLAALHGQCHEDLIEFFIVQCEIDPQLCNNDQKINPIHCACVSGSQETVEFLIKKAQEYQAIKDIAQAISISGDTLLHYAAISGSLELTKYLIESLKIKPDTPNDEGASPFHVAVFAHHQSLIHYYINLQTSAVLKPVETTGQNALHVAAARCHTDIVEQLIRKSSINPAAQDSFGCTPLHYAALSGNLGTVKFLLRLDMGLAQVVDNEKQNIFHFAVRSGNYSLVSFLASHHTAILDYRDKQYWTPLHHAVDICSLKSNFFSSFKPDFVAVSEDDQLKIIDFLINKMKCDLKCLTDDGQNLVHLSQNLMLVNYLIQKVGLDPNFCDHEGKNAVHYACLTGKLEIVKYLLDECRCSQFCLDNNGDSAVHFACWSGNIDFIKFLVIEKKCKPMIKDKKGHTPLHLVAGSNPLSLYEFYEDELEIDLNSIHTEGILIMALFGGHLSLVEHLLDECGYKELASLSDGLTFFHIAASNKNVLEYLQLRTKHRNSLPFIDCFGNTPLHFATNLESFKYLSLLTNAATTPNKQGITPIHTACGYGDLHTVRYLMKKYRKQMSLKTSDGRMPIHFAAQGCNVEVLKYLKDHSYDLNCTDSNGNTLLHLACSLDTPMHFLEDSVKGFLKQDECLRTIKLLTVYFKCNPNSVNNNKQTPLHLACQYGYIDAVA